MKKKRLPLPYRLGLKIGIERKRDLRPGEKPTAYIPYEGHIGWAMVTLTEAETKELPDIDAGEIVVIEYAKPDDMLESMSIQDYERRLAEATARLPPGTRIVRVPFDTADYRAFIKRTAREDNHQSRAAWAAEK